MMIMLATILFFTIVDLWVSSGDPYSFAFFGFQSPTCYTSVPFRCPIHLPPARLQQSLQRSLLFQTKSCQCHLITVQDRLPQSRTAKGR